MSIKKSYTLTISLFTIMALSGAVLSSTVFADTNTAQDNVAVNVPVSCTMNGTGMTSHTANIPNGTYEANIGTTTLKSFCNDSQGFAIYAIGYTNEEYGNTTLIGANGGQTIVTGTATTTGNPDVSNWAIKLETSSGATYPLTLDNGFGSYSSVPSTYTKVAHRDSGTDLGSSATGASLTTTYAAYISKGQKADTYDGKVKFTLVHPSDEPAPAVPPAPPTSCRTPVPNVTYMQDITSNNKAAVLASLNEESAYYIRDNRDEEPYCVSKLKDGNLWMLDNLRLDLTDSTILNSLTTTNTHVDSASLISLRSGNRNAGDQYAIWGFTIWEEYNDSFYQAQANADYKDTTTTSYGNGSGKIGVYYNYCAATAGSYCYNESEGVGDALYDLCPINWRMPTSGLSGEYNTLYNYYNTTQVATESASLQYKLSTPLSGEIIGDLYQQGSEGDFWTSTYRDSDGMYNLWIRPSNVYPNSSSWRNVSMSIRCLLGV